MDRYGQGHYDGSETGAPRPHGYVEEYEGGRQGYGAPEQQGYGGGPGYAPGPGYGSHGHGGSGAPPQQSYGGGPGYNSGGHPGHPGPGYGSHEPSYGQTEFAAPPPYSGSEYGHAPGHAPPKTDTHGSYDQQSGGEQYFKIYSEARPDFYLTARGDSVVLSPGNDLDPNQQWVKDGKWGARVKDEAGFPAFALVNRGAQMALSHGKGGVGQSVRLQRYNPESLDEAVLWTQSADVGNGYQCIRPVVNIHLNLDANHGDSAHGGVRDGTDLILHKWNKQENQKWKITPLASTPGGHTQFGQQSHSQPIRGRRVKLYSEARPEFYLTVRNGSAVLAPGSKSDEAQVWIKEDDLAGGMKDDSGAPAFVLISQASNKALKHGSRELEQVELVNVHPGHVDRSILWTLSKDVGDGFKCLRPVDNTDLNLDAEHGDKKHGGIKDGTGLVIYKWLKRENQKWKFVDA